jgi:nitroimidazol reductase NimA-like FMN-containing flavoprotein (pyridoxamine 5'-phosphate oxidase superfamily)
MRRTDREIKDLYEMILILRQALVCRIALCDKDVSYIVPLNYGLDESNPLVLYFHCATAGRKLEIIKENNKACFEVEIDVKLSSGSKACDWSMQYRSVIGTGPIEIVKSEEEKLSGLNRIMYHYSGNGDYEFDKKLIERMVVLKLTVEEMSGKEHLLA